MKKENLVWVCLAVIGIFAFTGCNDCNDPEPEPCPFATVEMYSTAEDSLCFGNWEWAYTLKWIRSLSQQDWVISDTVYPGETVLGFETFQYVRGTVNDREITFDMSGTIVNGCYAEWNSALYNSSSSISDTVVSATFYGWETPFGGLIVSAYLPEDFEDPIIAQISGLRMFYVGDEYEAGVRYRSRFIKIE